uniref:Uncharacterized protein n=1 Tax=Romanomermis culicivorax TaxID=13658 RepID=A0A915J9I4_ROMCU
MQQLILTTPAAPAVSNNLPMPWPPPVTSQFHCEEPCDVYITNDSFRETEPALAYSHPLLRVKLKAPSMDTLYNNHFLRTIPDEDDTPSPAPTRRPPPTAHQFGFSDYPPNDYYDHTQPQLDPLGMSHGEEDS